MMKSGAYSLILEHRSLSSAAILSYRRIWHSPKHRFLRLSQYLSVSFVEVERKSALMRAASCAWPISPSRQGSLFPCGASSTSADCASARLAPPMPGTAPMYSSSKGVRLTEAAPLDKFLGGKHFFRPCPPRTRVLQGGSVSDPVRFSHLRAYGRSPAHGQRARSHESDETTAMERGTAVHALLFDTRKVCAYPGVRRGKDYEAFAAEHACDAILTLNEYEKALRMADAVRTSKVAEPFLKGAYEQTLLFRWMG